MLCLGRPEFPAALSVLRLLSLQLLKLLPRVSSDAREVKREGGKVAPALQSAALVMLGQICSKLARENNAVEAASLAIAPPLVQRAAARLARGVQVRCSFLFVCLFFCLLIDSLLLFFSSSLRLARGVQAAQREIAAAAAAKAALAAAKAKAKKPARKKKAAAAKKRAGAAAAKKRKATAAKSGKAVKRSRSSKHAEEEEEEEAAAVTPPAKAEASKASPRRRDSGSADNDVDVDVLRQLLLNHLTVLARADSAVGLARRFHLFAWSARAERGSAQRAHFAQQWALPPAAVTEEERLALVDRETALRICAALCRDEMRRFFRRVFGEIALVLGAGKTTFRKLAVDSVALIVHEEPSLLEGQRLMSAITNRLDDQAISVRDSAIKLVGKCVRCCVLSVFSPCCLRVLSAFSPRAVLRSLRVLSLLPARCSPRRPSPFLFPTLPSSLSLSLSRPPLPPPRTDTSRGRRA